MITKNEKAKGLWWRLLATLPVLAVLLIANTKVAAQEQQSDKKDINIEIGWFEIYDDNGLPMNLSDTTIYNEDGSYIRFETTEAPDPISGETRSKTTVVGYNSDGTLNENFQFHLSAMEKHGDTTMYTVDPFTLSADNFNLKILTTEDNPVQVMEKDPDTVFQIVDEMPQFPGGEKALTDYMANNVKYPEEAKNKNIAGRVFVSFVVEKDGSVNEVKVLRGIGGGCDEEAVRVIKSMPKWKPGIQKGKPVRVSFQMPFVFKLDESATNDKVYDKAEVMPEYPGGEQAMMNFVATNVKYPQAAIDKNISGRVMVGFVVEKDGSITDVQVVKGVGGGCNEEAVRVVKAMPKWKPGKEKGKAVRVHYLLPITFKLK